MIFGSLFSGIEAASAAWLPLGWTCAWTAEVDPFARAVLRHHYPDVPNLGDVTEVDWNAIEPVDLVVAGPPCQDFSVAGNRAGLDGTRGNLSLAYVHALDAIDPLWSVTENVPGWLSMGDNAFGHFLGRLVGNDAPLVPGRGQRWTDAGVAAGPRRTAAWRILDAQYFGVPQRRRRVFVLAVRGAGNWASAEALFPVEPGVRRHPAPRREAGERIAPTIAGSSNGGGANGPGRDADSADSLIANPIGAKADGGWQRHRCRCRGRRAMTLAIRGRGDSHDLEYRDDGIANAIPTPNGGRAGIGVGAVAFGIRSDAARPGTALTPSADAEGRIRLRDPGFNVYEETAPTLDSTAHAVAVPILEVGKGSSSRGEGPNGAGFGKDGDPMFTLQAGAQHAVAFHENQRAEVTTSDTAGSLKLGGGKPGQGYPAIAFAELADPIANVATTGMSVRRLTPRECERLQGFPDDYTLIPYRSKPAADGPRYRALGNSFAVPVVRWVGQRIALVAGMMQP